MHLMNGYKISKGKRYDYYSIVKSVMKDGKRTKEIVVRLGKLSPVEAQQIDNVLKMTASTNTVVASPNDILFKDHWSYLETAVLNHLWNEWGLTQVFPLSDSKDIPTANIARILTFNRCLDAGSNLYAVEWFKGTTCDLMLNIKDPDKVNDSRIYRELKVIEKTKPQLERYLYKTLKERNKDSFNIVFYDLSNSHFEGKKCKLAKPWFTPTEGFTSKRIVLSLLLNAEGYPFSWDILEGDTVGVNTIRERTDYCKKHFRISNITMVFDRGMVSDDNLSYIEDKGYKYVTALDKDQIPNVPGFNPDWFRGLNVNNAEERMRELGFKKYDQHLYYKDLGSEEGRRYILGLNPVMFRNEREDREKRIKKGMEYLEKENRLLSQAKRDRDERPTYSRIDSKLKKLRVKKYLPFKLKPVKGTVKTFHIVRDEEKGGKAVRNAEILDGLCVFVTNHLDPEEFTAEQVIASYRDKNRVEEAFKDVKSFIKFQPVFVYLPVHVRAHYTICVLSYLLDMTITNKLREHGIDGVTSVRKAYRILGKSRIGRIKVKRFDVKRLSAPTPLGKEILKLLDCEYLITKKHLRPIRIE